MCIGADFFVLIMHLGLQLCMQSPPLRFLPKAMKALFDKTQHNQL